MIILHHGFASVTVNLETGEKTLRAASGDVTVPAPGPGSFAPEDSGITVEDGVITSEDRGYDGVRLYSFAGDGFE